MKKSDCANINMDLDELRTYQAMMPFEEKVLQKVFYCIELMPSLTVDRGVKNA